MAGSKFTEAQCVEMREMKMIQKKSSKEIMEYFKQRYGINVSYTNICNVCNPREKKEKTASASSETAAKPRKQYKKRAEKTTAKPEQDDLMAAVTQLDGEIKSFCARVRSVARREIIKYIARIRKTRMTMGETISKEETERLEEQLKEFDIDPKEVKEVGL